MKDEILGTLNPSEVIAQLKHLKVNNYPVTTIEYVHRHPEIFAPLMLDIMDEALTKTPELLRNGDHLYVVAMFTLARYRNKEALSRIRQLVKIISDAHNTPDLLGEMLIESIPSIVAACFDGDFKKLEEWFCTNDTYGLISVPGMALPYIAASKQISVNDAISFMERNVIRLIDQHPTIHTLKFHDFIDKTLDDLANYSPEACNKIILEKSWYLLPDNQEELDYTNRSYVEDKCSYHELMLERYTNQFNAIVEKGILAVSHWVGERSEEDLQRSGEDEFFTIPSIPFMESHEQLKQKLDNEGIGYFIGTLNHYTIAIHKSLKSAVPNKHCNHTSIT